MTTVGRLKDGDLLITGEFNERLPAITNFKIRYIRDWTNGSTANGGNHWVELQAIDYDGVNVALNKSVTSNASIGNGGYLVDGDTNTANYSFVNPEDGVPKYLQIDLGSLCNIKQVKVWHYYADGRTYYSTKTEISRDGVNWVPIFDSATQGTYVETSSGKTYDIPNSGLVAHYPFDNTDKGISYDKNILDTSQWVIGTSGSQGKFSINGTTAENQVINFTNPWGYEEATWATLGNDATSDDDGGWNTSDYTINRTKKYRLSVWVRRENAGNGIFYFGCQGSTVFDLGTTTRDGNPYFAASNFTEIRDNWVLFVGYIHPDGYAGGNDPTNGAYSLNGTRLFGITDYKWASDATVGGHRSYLYYSTTTTERQYWIRPRMEICDGTEASIQDLLKGLDNTINSTVNTSTTLTDNGIAVEEATTNIWTGGFTPYNNFGVPASITPLNETYMGQPVYRLAMTASSNLSHFQTTLDSHGVYGGSLSWVQDTLYVSSIYWRPVNKPDTVFGGTASNTAGWSAGPTEYLEDGWRRYYRYRTGAGVATNGDVVHHSFYCPSLQLNETIYIDVCCPQTEQGRSFPTSYVNGSRDNSTLYYQINGISSSPTHSVNFEYYHSDKSSYKSNMVMMSSYNGSTSGNWFGLIDKTNTLNPFNVVSPPNSWNKATLVYDGTNTKFYLNGVYQASSGGKTIFGNDYLSFSSMFGWVSSTYLASHKIRNVSVYNRALTDEEIKKLHNQSFKITKEGNLIADKIIEKPNSIPSDAIHIPLDFNGKDRLNVMGPSAENNTVYDKGSVWVGNSITNLLNGKLIAFTKTYGSYQGWELTGIANDNPRIYVASNIPVSASTTYTISMVYKSSTDSLDDVYIQFNDSGWPEGGIYLRVFEGQGGKSTVTVENLGGGYKYYTATFTTNAATNNIVQIFADSDVAGQIVFMGNLQLEQKPFNSPFTSNSRADSELEFNLNRDYGLSWAGDWSLVYWKKPVGTYAGDLNGYSIESLGCNSNSVGGGYVWFGKTNGSNTITFNPSGAGPTFTPTDYFNDWQMVSLVKSGTTVTFTNWSRKMGNVVKTATVSTAAANYYVNQYGYDLKLSGWDNANPGNAYFKDLIVAKRAFTNAELNALYNTQMRAYPDRIQIQGSIRDNQTL